jgi:hypothetical protein
MQPKKAAPRPGPPTLRLPAVPVRPDVDRLRAVWVRRAALVQTLVVAVSGGTAARRGKAARRAVGGRGEGRARALASARVDAGDTLEVSLPLDGGGSREARAVVERLRGRIAPSVLEDAQLVVSELVTKRRPPHRRARRRRRCPPRRAHRHDGAPGGHGSGLRRGDRTTGPGSRARRGIRTPRRACAQRTVGPRAGRRGRNAGLGAASTRPAGCAGVRTVRGRRRRRLSKRRSSNGRAKAERRRPRARAAGPGRSLSAAIGRPAVSRSRSRSCPSGRRRAGTSRRRRPV